MDIVSELQKSSLFSNLELLATQVVEGFVSGIHKSPFHGFSAEFAEHKIYNKGESTKHIDWKLYAKTDKLYTKRYEEETNLRCHMILDNSASMYYPSIQNPDVDNLNKISFGVLAIAALMQILKKQRDAVGLSVYAGNYSYYAPEKGSERHYQMLFAKLNAIAQAANPEKKTDMVTHLHEIAEKMHRRSLFFLFTDLLQDTDDQYMFDALQHLKYKKHEVILFHLLDKEKEVHFNFDDTPKRFVDVETGAQIDVYAHQIRKHYETAINDYINAVKLKCAQYKIQYVEADVHSGFSRVLNTFLVARQKFL
ncbi:DUF58 domain-containing protein [Arenibacter sp. GZD96]|uniref:DUF58 domain-containing protein n=1 Tax=Aurantibrevibacter litoralis TaxID=3106030 RepID=UPI002AFEDC84|nr:DUF58 domain-containing protein [Arenibacter sp. GZD-96]MEA1784687.1 DUF58 domain-containing protein [Arenibacter sp. GZD-96]